MKIKLWKTMTIVSLTLIWACIDKLGSFDINRVVEYNIAFNQVQAGDSLNHAYLFSMQKLRNEVEKKSGTGIRLSEISVYKVALSTPDTVSLMFEDMENAKLSAFGRVLGTLPDDAKGKYIEFEINDSTAQEDFVKSYNENKDVLFRLDSKAKNVVQPGVMEMQIVLRIKGDILAP